MEIIANDNGQKYIYKLVYIPHKKSILNNIYGYYIMYGLNDVNFLMWHLSYKRKSKKMTDECFKMWKNSKEVFLKDFK